MCIGVAHPAHAHAAQRQSTPAPFTAPTWAFPTAPALNPAPKPDSVVKHRVPKSTREYTMREVGNSFNIPDWFPESHPAAPAPVLYGTRPNGLACGFCHLPDGQGRPENSTLAGLPVDYVVRQVRAFRDSTRLSASPTSKTKTNSMHGVAAAVSDSDVLEAARYFATLPLTRPNHVHEVTRAPKVRMAGGFYVYDGEGTEPLDGRLIEAPAEFERHELRDPTVEYSTYVPVGSLARGRRLVNRGPNGSATMCVTCHGPRLLGKDNVPPIAGRSPSSILRQLIGFRVGTRRDSASIAMAPVVERLTVEDMVALSAYVGSLPPSAPRRVSPRKRR
jgi:cytochrome c553